MRAIHQLAREQMIQAKTRMAEAENHNRPVQEFKTGDYVMLSLEHIQLPVWAVSKCRKLRGKYFGPFPIVQVHKNADAYSRNFAALYGDHETGTAWG